MRPAPTPVSRHNRLTSHIAGALAAFAGLAFEPALAQELLRPGEAFATRFSGTTTMPGPDGKPVTIIDPAGTVGSIVDLRAPGVPPLGEHWVNEPQRKPITAREVGQVFGVTLDANGPPNIFLAATSAFGLHRNADNSGWMEGMWGENGGGPGTIYVLDRENGYAPRKFAQVTLNGRLNSGPGLGNIAYDKWNNQLFASDLETGMIHRFGADGSDRGYFDHGTQGRPKFRDVARGGEAASLPAIVFDPNSKPRITDCPAKFDNSPDCWNFAASGRRVWGLAVWKHPRSNETRLYYSVWSGPNFADSSWTSQRDDDKRNSVWSVRLDPDGGFVTDDVRREFIMPDFFKNPDSIAQSGYSSPVSDISFPECGGAALMMVGERGGIRNLGLDVERPFASPHEARAFRVALNEQGVWRVQGRYDVGFYSRRLDGEPFVRSNCAGGVAFGPGYTDGRADFSKPNQFAWISGDALCSVDGPCNNPSRRPEPGPQPPSQPQVVSDDEPAEPDDSEVHGLQGMPIDLYGEILPAAATNDQAAGTDQAYLIDIDINVDPSGTVIPETLLRNDATKIGDLAIYQNCEPGAVYDFVYPPPFAGHWPVFSHSRRGSHNPRYSHHRHGTHNPKLSHERARSHTRTMTHYRHASRRGDDPGRERASVHPKERSHVREISAHRRPQSHNPRLSGDVPVLSHNRRLSHPVVRSHNPRVSHLPPRSHNQRISDTHSEKRSHAAKGSHNPRISDPHSTERSHAAKGSHNPRISNPHSEERSHAAKGSHNPQISGHTRPRSHAATGSHNPQISNHSRPRSHAAKGSHNPQISGHNRPRSHAATGSHNPRVSQNVPRIHGGPQFRPQFRPNRGDGRRF